MGVQRRLQVKFGQIGINMEVLEIAIAELATPFWNHRCWYLALPDLAQPMSVTANGGYRAFVAAIDAHERLGPETVRDSRASPHGRSSCLPPPFASGGLSPSMARTMSTNPWMAPVDRRPDTQSPSR